MNCYSLSPWERPCSMEGQACKLFPVTEISLSGIVAFPSLWGCLSWPRIWFPWPSGAWLGIFLPGIFPCLKACLRFETTSTTNSYQQGEDVDTINQEMIKGQIPFAKRTRVQGVKGWKPYGIVGKNHGAKILQDFP